MGPALKPSQRACVLGAINPQSLAPGSLSTGWVDMALVQWLMASIATGVLGAAATVDAKLQQATDNAGAGVKDIAGKAIAQFVKATDDNKQALINVKQDDLDVNNGFRFVRLTITVGTAASLIDGKLWGFDPRYNAADANAAASQAQVVG